MKPTLAIDPGQNGAAVLLAEDGRTILAAWAWHECQHNRRRAYRLEGIGRQWVSDDTWMDGVAWTADVPYHTLARVGQDIAFELWDWEWEPVLVVEGLFVHRNWESTLTLAESAAMVYGPTAAHLDTMPLRPKANATDGTGWRETVLGRGPRRARKAYWDEQARRLLPHLVDAGGLGDLIADDNVIAAACMARWGWLMQKAEEG